MHFPREPTNYNSFLENGAGCLIGSIHRLLPACFKATDPIEEMWRVWNIIFYKFHSVVYLFVKRSSPLPRVICMINEVIGTTPEGALNGTTVLNTLALVNGADILRVHDVLQAVQAVKLHAAYRGGPQR